MSSSTSVVRSVKIQYGDDLRRFPLSQVTSLPTLDSLVSLVKSTFNLKTNPIIKYVDEEEEKVTVASVNDLQEAIQIARDNGKSIVKFFVFDGESKETGSATTNVPLPAPTAPEATKAAPAPEKTGSSSVPAPTPVAPEVKTDSSSSSSSKKESSEEVLKAIQGFFGDASVVAALPNFVSLFLDSFVSSGNVTEAFRFTLDANPTVKAAALMQLALKYLEQARPYVESLTEPLRLALVSGGAQLIGQIKSGIRNFGPLVIPMLTNVVQTLTPASLEQAWRIIKTWSADPSRPFPYCELKSIVGFGPAADGACRFGGLGGIAAFAPMMRNMMCGGFGGQGMGMGAGPRGPHHGHGHPFAHGPGAGAGGNPFCGMGWRGMRRAARAAAEAQHQQQQTASPQPPTAPTGNPFVDLLDSFGQNAELAGEGIASILNQVWPRPVPTQAPTQASSSTDASSSSTVPEESAPKSDVHQNIICDGCGIENFKGLRFKCSVCPDFDLCASCEAKGEHDPSHPMLKFTHSQERRCRGGWRHMHHGMHHGMHHPHGQHGGHGGWWRRSQQAAQQGLSMKFVRDVTISDRTSVAPNEMLIKRWLVTNDGEQVWPQGTKLIFVRGDPELVDGEEFPVTGSVEPGQSVEVSCVLKTPALPGRYQAFFRMADADRNPFGNRLWVDLMVGAEEKPVSASAPPAATIPVAQPVLVKPVVEEKAAEPEPVYPVILESASLAQINASASAPPAPTAPQAKYALQLQLLDGMGFKNKELNQFLLESNQGDVVTVANWLLEKMK